VLYSIGAGAHRGTDRHQMRSWWSITAENSVDKQMYMLNYLYNFKVHRIQIGAMVHISRLTENQISTFFSESSD
jgi:hypothetical protein